MSEPVPKRSHSGYPFPDSFSGLQYKVKADVFLFAGTCHKGNIVSPGGGTGMISGRSATGPENDDTLTLQGTRLLASFPPFFINGSTLKTIKKRRQCRLFPVSRYEIRICA